jgi:pantoate--beta-alanine ligase
MILFKRAGDLTAWLHRQQTSGQSIGFVPTMGALHEGHISLITISKKSTSLTVCSIFVNPTQFNDPKDFQKYPVTLEKDIALLEKAGADVLFLPEITEIYPQGTTHLENYDLGPLETLLEGKYRPGHFQGVCQVMQRLLHLVRPDHLFMGSKDYQQCMVVQRLLGIMELPATLHRCPIIREADGLAMSSRNARLNPTQRANATAIYRALTAIKTGWTTPGSRTAGNPTADNPTADNPTAGTLKPNNPTANNPTADNPTALPIPTLIENAIRLLESAQFRVDYVSIADARTLEPIAAPPAGAVALIAAFQGEVRLIDNMILS